MTVRTSFDPTVAFKLLKKIPLFAGLTDLEVQSLLVRTNTYRCRRGETIFLEENNRPLMYIILKGQVKVVEITSDGLERVMAFRQRGDYFGDMALLDGKSDYATVIAMDQCTLLLITKNLFDEYFLESPRALRGVIAALCRRLRDSWLFNTIIGANDAESKIRVTLAHYGNTMGIADSSGVIIDTSLSHQSIADRVLITRETASRALMRMRDQGEIEIMAGRRIKLLPVFYDRIAQCELYKSLAGMQNNHH
jgi:CRP/FNR family transcriptional regulator, cyclic AMP receptor protein